MPNTLGAVCFIQNRKDIYDKFNCTADNINISVVAIIHNTHRALYRAITWPVTPLQNTTSLFVFMTTILALVLAGLLAERILQIRLKWNTLYNDMLIPIMS